MTINKGELLKQQSIFLDRDGVINQRIIDDYVKNIKEFVFIDGSLEAIEFLSLQYKYIFIVTNQQGVAKNIMQLEDVHKVHKYMLSEIKKNNGRIDKIYICPDLANSGSLNRKPNTGMALQAQYDFPDLNFNNSIMIGDSATDIEFGKRLNMSTIKIGKQANSIVADFCFESLIDFINFLRN